MKKFFSCILLMLVMLCSCAMAQERGFDEICQRLMQSGWLADGQSAEEIAIDSEATPVKFYVSDGTAYAELIVNEEGAPFQYAFYGKTETVEDLAACIAAYGEEDAQGIAQAVMKAYEESRVFQSSRPVNSGSEPRGVAIRENIRYELDHGWLYIMDLETARKML